MSAFEYDEVSRRSNDNLDPGRRLPKWKVNDLGLELGKPADKRDKVQPPGGERIQPGIILPNKSGAQIQREWEWDARGNSEIYSPFPKADPAKVDQDIARAAEKLGSNHGNEREDAEKAFIAGGLRSLPQLAELQRSPDKYVRDKATELANRIELRSILSNSLDAIAQHEELDRAFQKLPADWPDRYERLINFMDNNVDGKMLDRQLERLRRDPKFADSLALADLEQLNQMRARLRLDYAESLLQPGKDQNIPKAIKVLEESLEKGSIDPADVQFLRLARQAGAFDNAEFRRTFLAHDGDVTDAGGKFNSPAEAEQYYRRRLAIVDAREKYANSAPRETTTNSAGRTLRERLAGVLRAQGKEEEARKLEQDSRNQDLKEVRFR